MTSKCQASIRSGANTVLPLYNFRIELNRNIEDDITLAIKIYEAAEP